MYSTYGYGSGPILLSNLACNGFELSILECNSSGLGITDGCYHYLDAGVVCQGRSPRKWNSIKVATARGGREESEEGGRMCDGGSRVDESAWEGWD